MSLIKLIIILAAILLSVLSWAHCFALDNTDEQFLVDMPILISDTAFNAYGLWSFGVHGGGHALDGHPGFDVEFVAGASVRAAANGTIQHIVPDMHTAGRYNIRMDHRIGRRNYATDYTNIGPLATGIKAGAIIQRGQELGVAGIQTQMMGTSKVTWAMTHFQVNDFTKNEGLTNPNAVCALPYLSETGKTVFAAIWKLSASNQALCEPFADNPRDIKLPLIRTWTRKSGNLWNVIIFKRNDFKSNDYEYKVYDDKGIVIEKGTVSFISKSGGLFSTICFYPESGKQKSGICIVKDYVMKIELSADNSIPSNFSNASTYTTTRAGAEK